MGQARNSGRNASLDERKKRAAGRTKNPSRRLDTDVFKPGEKAAGGAFGAGKTRTSNLSKGGGGGGASQMSDDGQMSGAAAGKKTQAEREIEGSRELVKAREKAAKTAGKTLGARGAKTPKSK